LITDKGKDILAKYLISQAPSYASYIAIGCGAKPLSTSAFLENYSEKQALDFEMFRIPIVSRGYIEEDGVSKVVFIGELPSEERYEITEIGIFSAGSNVNAGSSDSKILFSFSSAEAWKFHDTEDETTADLVFVESSLNSVDTSSIDSEYDFIAFTANSTNGVFDTDERLSLQERPRLLDSSVFISGNTSQIFEKSTDPNDLEVNTSLDNHIDYTDNVDLSSLSQNSSNDKIKTAFSIIGKEASPSPVSPDRVKIIIEFLSGESTDALVARIPISYNATDPLVDFNTNRYLIHEIGLESLKGRGSGFSWEAVTQARIYASAEKKYSIFNGAPGTEYSITAVALTDTNTKLQFTSAGHNLVEGSNVKFSGVSGITDVRKVTDVTTDTFKIKGTTLPTLTSATVRTAGGVTLTDTNEITNTNEKLQFITTTNHGFAVGSEVDLSGVSEITNLRSITDVTEDTFKIAGTTLPTLTDATASAPTSNYLIALDGIRLENISTPNSLYGLTAYSPIVNNSRPIVKTANSSNVVEFRFAMSVGIDDGDS
jgi:hypothetical protein